MGEQRYSFPITTFDNQSLPPQERKNPLNLIEQFLQTTAVISWIQIQIVEVMERVQWGVKVEAM